MKSLYYVVVGLLSFPLLSQGEILKDFDSLGGNDVLLERARVLQPDKKISIVQNRVVKRSFRHEASFTSTGVFGGNAFMNTNTLGVDYHFHINPKWAVGLSYFQGFNSLTNEGEFLISNDNLVPQLDGVLGGYEALLNYYPMYGKFNFFDMAIVHFDLYGILTYGQIELQSGATQTYSFGGGIGFWLTQHLTARLEVRERFYQASRKSRSVDLDVTMGSLSIGYLL